VTLTLVVDEEDEKPDIWQVDSSITGLYTLPMAKNNHTAMLVATHFARTVARFNGIPVRVYKNGAWYRRVGHEGRPDS